VQNSGIKDKKGRFRERIKAGDRIVDMATSDNFRSPIPFYRQQLSVIYQSDLRKYVERISENKMWIMQFRSGRTNFPEAEKVIGSATRG
jgi:hypothetical protein